MYKITITFTQVVPKRSDDIAAGGGYKTEVTEIYSQSVEDLDIQGVIAAANYHVGCKCDFVEKR